MYRIGVKRQYMVSRDVKEERGRVFGEMDRSLL